MDDPRRQHLSQAFNSIISMMLAALRARGLRALLDLPNIIIASIYLRRLAREFSKLLASIDFSALPAAPAPQAAPAPLPTLAPAPARPRPAAFPRAHHARRAASSRPGPAAPDAPARHARIPATRHHDVAKRQPTPDPRAVLRPLETARSS